MLVVSHWGSKLHSSDSIHSPRVAEHVIILAVSMALGLLAVKHGGWLWIFQTCFAVCVTLFRGSGYDAEKD